MADKLKDIKDIPDKHQLKTIQDYNLQPTTNGGHATNRLNIIIMNKHLKKRSFSIIRAGPSVRNG